MALSVWANLATHGFENSSEWPFPALDVMVCWLTHTYVLPLLAYHTHHGVFTTMSYVRCDQSFLFLRKGTCTVFLSDTVILWMLWRGSLNVQAVYVVGLFGLKTCQWGFIFISCGNVSELACVSVSTIMWILALHIHIHCIHTLHALTYIHARTHMHTLTHTHAHTHTRTHTRARTHTHIHMGCILCVGCTVLKMPEIMSVVFE